MLYLQPIYILLCMTKRVKHLGVGAVLLLGFLVIFFLSQRGGESAPSYSSFMVEKQTLVQSVNETGTVTADVDVSYGWEVSGRVASVLAEVGDIVSSSVTIATLENTAQRATLSEAQARLAAAQAALNLEIAGPSSERRDQSQAEIDQAQASLDEAKVQLEATKITAENSVESAHIALEKAKSSLNNQSDINSEEVRAAYEDAVQEMESSILVALDALITYSNIQYTYDELNGGEQRALKIASKKAAVLKSLVGASNAGSWQASGIVSAKGGLRGEVEALARELDPDFSDVDRLTTETISVLRSLDSALDEMLLALNSVTSAGATDKTTLDTERAAVDAAIVSMLTVQQAIASTKVNNQSTGDQNQLSFEQAEIDLRSATRKAQQDIASAEALVAVREAALRQREASHAFLIAPPRNVDIARLRADVSRERANVERAQNDVQKTELYALAPGVISDIKVEVGENVTANQAVVTIISSELGIDVDVSESDIAKVAVDDVVMITLDAFGDEQTFQGHVSTVEPAETEISGVIYYKTEIIFDDGQEASIRPGMTANIEILTDRKEGAIAIPQRAIIRDDSGQKVVRVLTNPETVSYDIRPVETGIKGNDGLIEIVSGLAVQDEVITFLSEE